MNHAHIVQTLNAAISSLENNMDGDAGFTMIPFRLHRKEYSSRGIEDYLSNPSITYIRASEVHSMNEERLEDSACHHYSSKIVTHILFRNRHGITVDGSLDCTAKRLGIRISAILQVF